LFFLPYNENVDFDGLHLQRASKAEVKTLQVSVGERFFFWRDLNS
jgi:hypothetical protein